ncbi:toll/interleukin-1 receptor domain-containing protein [Syntrophotalea acetylenica]|uniref:toll/interleukin-1 receptor domain-containing protein n=1 Tax=Syntrophotalea acetylenica TaxID=29542 RepID=UPI002A3638D6|nr:toll/interleukin-1 receptor domain-containing protein [Syntrophotalea acetylenica]MDY0263428.1 toll/interleukin-1 receptor domain-containing protein [Syntrophotalea acetylenica]
MKVFLSHSSKDKESYVRLVADRIGDGNYVLDERTFEDGEFTRDEIIKGIDESDMFAFFISNFALESDWVKLEVKHAEIRLNSSQLKKIYPIIIDQSIKYDDPRIPIFLREHYNLKLITRPTVAARRIKSKLRELHWQKNPTHKKRQTIFVGRNDILSDFENRMDDIDLPKPTCIIASGLSKIGRSKLVSMALSKANVVTDNFNPTKIILDRVDSIEDLIIKIIDTGLTNNDNNIVSDLLGKPVYEKEKILAELLRQIHDAREVLFIDDNGCLVNYSRQPTSWLMNSLEILGNLGAPAICISARYRVDRRAVRNKPLVYTIEVPELSPKERAGLLRRILELYEISLSPDDFRFFSEQLKGFPEEVYYCADLIADLGVLKAKKETHQITEFNEERASLLLRKYEGNSDVLDFIYLLSEFEFIGINFLYEIVDEDQYSPVLEDLITNLICDYIGYEKDYIRLNDSIRDFVKRNRLSLRGDLRNKLSDHVQRFVNDTEKFDRDAADFFYSIKTALAQGKKIDDRFLAPSHILRTIKELYQKRENLNRVIGLADMLLSKENSLDSRVSEDARYYLCLSLARQKDKRLLNEVQKINGAEHDFVLGYYYRLCGRHTDAIERLSKLVDTPYVSSRAKRELVQVYIYIEDYDKALGMAKDNYENNKGNQFFIQSYLNCLLNNENYVSNKDLIFKLIEELDGIKSQQSIEMTFIAKAQYSSKMENRKEPAYGYLDDALGLDQDSIYPLLAKFDISLRHFDLPVMEATLGDLQRVAQKRTISQNTISKNRAYYLAAKGDIPEAYKILETSFQNYPVDSIERFRRKLINISERKSDL